MTPSDRRQQRGEGKIGCIVTLLVLVVAIATGIKAVPVYWSDYELKDAAKDMASRASVLTVEALELQLRSKARDLGIAEAMAPGAIKATKAGDGLPGSVCTIHLKYKRAIDLYGIYTWDVKVDTTASSPFLSAM